jgi:hypothetical protein
MPTFPNYPSGQPAAQSLFQISTGACPDAYVSVANVITGPKLTFKIREVETTAHPVTQVSGATIAATYVPTISERNMTLDISIKTDSAQYDLLVALAKNSTFFDWRIVNADSLLTDVLGSGFFTQFDLDFPVAGMVKATAAIRVSGDVAYGR